MSCLVNDPHVNPACCSCSRSPHPWTGSSAPSAPSSQDLLENQTPGREGDSSPALLTQDTVFQLPPNTADHDLFNSGAAGSAAQ